MRHDTVLTLNNWLHRITAVVSSFLLSHELFLAPFILLWYKKNTRTYPSCKFLSGSLAKNCCDTIAPPPILWDYFDHTQFIFRCFFKRYTTHKSRGSTERRNMFSVTMIVKCASFVKACILWGFLIIWYRKIMISPIFFYVTVNAIHLSYL